MKYVLSVLILLLTINLSYSQGYNSFEHSVVSKSKKLIYITDVTNNSINVFDVKTFEIIDEIKLSLSPSGVAINPKTGLLYVTAGSHEGLLYEIDTQKNKIKRKIRVGHTPMSPVIEDCYLYLCTKFENKVKKIQISTLEIEEEAKTTREPVSIQINSQSDRVYVANHLPDGVLTSYTHASEINIFNKSDLSKVKDIKLPSGSNALNAMYFDKVDSRLYITHILGRYRVPTNQVERGWINTNALSIIDTKNDDFLCTVMLDDLDKGAANPFDVKADHNTNSLLVTHSGTNELSIIDLEKFNNKLEQTKAGIGIGYARNLKDVSNDLTFLAKIRKKIKLNGLSPKSISVIDNGAYVVSYFNATLEKVNLEDNSIELSYTMGQEVNSMARQGEIYFQDATLCKQNWQSCVSCHPGNARADALNWDLLNDGIGNPKNTKSLLYAHQTAPAMATGIRANAEVAVRAGIEHILYTKQDPKIANAIDAYLKKLTHLKSPYLVNGKLSENAKEGKKIFERSGCVKCHSGEYYTNLKSYNLGTGKGQDKDKKFDTPSLVELWRSAPYLHDGSVNTVEEAIKAIEVNSPNKVSETLTKKEMGQLVEFCLSL